MQTIILGGGCFWCTEAVFKELRGLHAITPGYGGGDRKDPSYEAVASGTTGHAEVIRVEFDPQIISLEDILNVFFATHDPTTLNRQGNDRGPQYRSIIFYTTDEQKKTIQNYIHDLEPDFGNAKIVTEVKPFKNFYEAETYHQDYYARNTSAPYCRVIIDPKLKKLRQRYRELMKKGE